MSMINKKIEKRVIARLQKASLHLLEASHLCWNSEERPLSNDIRVIGNNIDALSMAINKQQTSVIRKKLGSKALVFKG